MDEARPLEDLIRELLQHPGIGPCIQHVERIPPRPAQTAPWPEDLHSDLVKACQARGIALPYTHQAAAVQHAIAGRHVVTVTPTASGKTLCYNLPVLNEILRDPEARALYLFPTKALSHDQYRDLYEMSQGCGREIRVYTYDGDTPPATRRTLRSAGHIVVTNPDMLHSGILPHHTSWTKLFENLRYVVIDELHHYRGIFGSHLANVLRRLERLCKFYGVRPTYLASSATIANPRELAEELTGQRVEIVTESGAPTGEKVFIFYNPPAVNKELNVRRSLRLEATRLALRLVLRGHQAIVFGRSRMDVEVMTTYLRRGMARLHRDPTVIQGYRSGYLPKERRAIEDGVKNGTIRGIVSTNALELGIDIGGLDVSILAGWPGTVASAWQQAGRAGRKAKTSLAIFVAGNSPLDQFLMQHPEFFFGKSPEQGIINPENLVVLSSHLKCGAFELPFDDGEAFGKAPPTPMLEYLDDEKVLRHSGGRWYYSSDDYPAENVSLRGGAGENFIVLDNGNNNRVLAEVDFDSAPFLIHDDAIYIHNGRTFYVEKLEWDRRTAYVREKRVDYYTDAESSSTVQVLAVDQEIVLEPSSPRGRLLAAKRFGDVNVTMIIAKFKKVKFETHESVGYGPVNVPALELQTESLWFSFREELPRLAKAAGFEAATALRGFANLLRHTVPLYVLCDPQDITVYTMLRSPFDQRPAVFVWDRFPGGTGISRRLFAIEGEVLRAARQMLDGCPCKDGCPSCIGPTLDVGDHGRSATRWLLDALG